jgi:hypothetical protein
LLFPGAPEGDQCIRTFPRSTEIIFARKATNANTVFLAENSARILRVAGGYNMKMNLNHSKLYSTRWATYICSVTIGKIQHYRKLKSSRRKQYLVPGEETKTSMHFPLCHEAVEGK